MSSLNRATLIGNVGKDPEIRSLNNGDRVANLSIATSETWKDKNSGEKKERTEWHRVTVWGNLVDVIEKYVSKGDKLMIEGKIVTRKYQKDGEDRYATEIVLQGFDAKMIMLGGKKDGDGGRSSGGGGGGSQSYASEGGFEPDSEIPFATPFSVW